MHQINYQLLLKLKGFNSLTEMFTWLSTVSDSELLEVLQQEHQYAQQAALLEAETELADLSDIVDLTMANKVLDRFRI